MASVVTDTVKPKGINVILLELCCTREQGNGTILSTESEDTCEMEMKSNSHWAEQHLKEYPTPKTGFKSELPLHSRLPSLLPWNLGEPWRARGGN